MTPDEAAAFIAPAVAPPVGTWVDAGAGTGTFTLALAAVLDPEARIIAVDRDAGALRRLSRAVGAAAGGAPSGRIETVVADFRDPAGVEPASAAGPSGVLFANALHFDPAPERVLTAWAERLVPGGRMVVVEYDRRPANPWVPYPLGVSRLASAASAAGLAAPVVVAERASSYGGVLYCAWLSGGSAA